MLPYDQIPQDRRAIGDFTGRLDEHNGAWASRSPSGWPATTAAREHAEWWASRPKLYCPGVPRCSSR
jgi:hypothetical protein